MMAMLYSKDFFKEASIRIAEEEEEEEEISLPRIHSQINENFIALSKFDDMRKKLNKNHTDKVLSTAANS